MLAQLRSIRLSFIYPWRYADPGSRRTDRLQLPVNVKCHTFTRWQALNSVNWRVDRHSVMCWALAGHLLGGRIRVLWSGETLRAGI